LISGLTPSGRANDIVPLAVDDGNTVLGGEPRREKSSDRNERGPM